MLAAAPAAQQASCADAPAVAELAAFRATMLHALRQDIEHRPIIADDRALRRYLTGLIGSAPVEHFVVLYLDARNVLVCDAVLAVGGVDAVHVRPREVIARALEVGAAGLVLVHNHPSGDPLPTADDLALTRSLAQVARVMDLRVVDHVIVAASKTFSFRREGLLPCM